MKLTEVPHLKVLCEDLDSYSVQHLLFDCTLINELNPSCSKQSLLEYEKDNSVRFILLKIGFFA